MDDSPFIVKPISWESPEGDMAKDIRIRVFVEEQKVPLEEEIDAIDATCFHVLAYDGEGKAWGTGRLYPDKDDPELGHIGRMAVLPEARGKGCGAAIMEALMGEAGKKGYLRIILSSQKYAAGFYGKFGFRTTGEPYMDVGISHIDMIRDI
jgi:predicted GNAT family N-acyltransferase